jgi:hypothetical protein
MEIELDFWARIAPPRVPETRTQPIKMGGAGIMPMCTEGDLNKERVTVAGTGSQEAAPAAAEAAEQTSKEAESTQTADRRPSQGAPAAKRVSFERRVIPDTMKKVVVAGDGNCVYSAFAAALKKATGQVLHTRTVRAEISAHMAKNAGSYSKSWDGKGPNDETFERGFAEYVTTVGRMGTQVGSLELSALARKYDIAIYVISEMSEKENVVYHRQAENKIVLWHSNKHYDWLDGKLSDEVAAGCVPGPLTGGRGGGRPRAAAQAAAPDTDAASTAPTAWTRATVWTRAPTAQAAGRMGASSSMTSAVSKAGAATSSSQRQTPSTVWTAPASAAARAARKTSRAPSTGRTASKRKHADVGEDIAERDREVDEMLSLLDEALGSDPVPRAAPRRRTRQKCDRELLLREGFNKWVNGKLTGNALCAPTRHPSRSRTATARSAACGG